MSTRDWPLAHIDRTFHLVGDVQGIPYMGVKLNRAEVVLRDAHRATVPKVEYTLQVGDFCSSGPETFFGYTRDWMDDLVGDGSWTATIGNHDKPITELEPDYARSADRAATLLGNPAKNFVLDLGYAVLLVFYVRAWGHSTEEAPDFEWLAATLDQYAGRNCMVMAHPPIRGSLPNGAADMLAVDDTALKAVLNPRPQARVWLCGHTHSALIMPVAKHVSLGARDIVQINGSALLNNAPGGSENKERWDPLRSLYVSMFEDRAEVRFRDHGAGVWLGGNPTLAKKIVLPW